MEINMKVEKLNDICRYCRAVDEEFKYDCTRCFMNYLTDEKYEIQNSFEIKKTIKLAKKVFLAPDGNIYYFYIEGRDKYPNCLKNDLEKIGYFGDQGVFTLVEMVSNYIEYHEEDAPEINKLFVLK